MRIVFFFLLGDFILSCIVSPSLLRKFHSPGIQNPRLGVFFFCTAALSKRIPACYRRASWTVGPVIFFNVVLFIVCHQTNSDGDWPPLSSPPRFQGAEPKDYPADTPSRMFGDTSTHTQPCWRKHHIQIEGQSFFLFDSCLPNRSFFETMLQSPFQTSLTTHHWLPAHSGCEYYNKKKIINEQ